MALLEKVISKVSRRLSQIVTQLRLPADSKAREVVATSMLLCRHPSLPNLLQHEVGLYVPLLSGKHKLYIGWGRKGSGRLAVALARKHKADYLVLEDGFIRSIDRNDAPLSIVFDTKGIHYDATQPSLMEDYIADDISEEEFERSQNVMRLWQENRVSKYNGTREYSKPLPERYVIVMDQVAGDMSIEKGLASPQSFEDMLQSALIDNPDCHIVLKVHPDVYSRNKQGHYDLDELSRNKRIIIVAEACHPVKIMENAEKVYTVTSQVGFEALMLGKQVHCFGMPFYAGWGCTNDMLPTPERRKKVSLEQLVNGVLLKYPRYIDAFTQKESRAEEIIQYVGRQISLRHSYPSHVYAYNFSRWKQPHLERFVQGSNVIFVSDFPKIPDAATVIVWGQQMVDGVERFEKVLRIEDGFLRSSGLGADLTRPLSWVIDDTGIYYDASRPSVIENILNETAFSETLLKRASELRQKILDSEVSKYNIKGSDWHKPANNKKIILAVGQVENDASILYGSPETKTNIGLLEKVRMENPDAYLVYKPHPDVVAGLRRSGKNEQQAKTYCDEIVYNADPLKIIPKVDEVHTMTSLLGFEALLRDIKVVCYGMPFYAGWGLTSDKMVCERRKRDITINQLIAAALILYPRYVCIIGSRFIEPEQAIEQLVEWKSQGQTVMPFWRRCLRTLLKIWAQSGLRRSG